MREVDSLDGERAGPVGSGPALELSTSVLVGLGGSRASRSLAATTLVALVITAADGAEGHGAEQSENEELLHFKFSRKYVVHEHHERLFKKGVNSRKSRDLSKLNPAQSQLKA